MTKKRNYTHRRSKPEIQRDTIVKSFEGGATMVDSCRAVGISTTCYYNWLKAYPEFAKRIEEVELKKIQSVEGAMFKRAIGYEVEETHIVKGFPMKSTKHIPADPTLDIFLSCNLLPEKYKNIQRVDTNSRVVSEVAISDEDRVLLKGIADTLTRLKAGIK